MKNHALPASNSAVLKSLIFLHADACKYAGTAALRQVYMASIMLRRAKQLRLPRK